MPNIKIPIGSATASQLRYYAETVLGLDGISKANQTSVLIGKITAAVPDLTEIEAPDNLAGDVSNIPTAAAARSMKRPSIPAGREGTHFRHDPKVTVNVLPTNDKTRAKRVFVSVNGDVIEIQRGQNVSIPYRFYRALQDAVEIRPLETDEINPVTGLPFIEMIEQPSYPFSVISMPSQEEIDAWMERTADAAL